MFWSTDKYNRTRSEFKFLSFINQGEFNQLLNLKTNKNHHISPGLVQVNPKFRVKSDYSFTVLDIIIYIQR